MNPDIQSRIAMMRGFKESETRLHTLRVKEIRESDIITQLSSFDGLFELSLTGGIPRSPYALSKSMRVFFGVNK